MTKIIMCKGCGVRGRLLIRIDDQNICDDCGQILLDRAIADVWDQLKKTDEQTREKIRKDLLGWMRGILSYWYEGDGNEGKRHPVDWLRKINARKFAAEMPKRLKGH